MPVGYIILVLPTLSGSYPRVRGTLAIHYSPVRHWCIAAPVRLACLSHAASVQAEPGSNSSIVFRRIPPDPHARRYTETDSFTGGFIVEKNSSVRNRSRQTAPGFDHPSPARRTSAVCKAQALTGLLITIQPGELLRRIESLQTQSRSMGIDHFACVC